MPLMMPSSGSKVAAVTTRVTGPLMESISVSTPGRLSGMAMAEPKRNKRPAMQPKGRYLPMRGKKPMSSSTPITAIMNAAA